MSTHRRRPSRTNKKVQQTKRLLLGCGLLCVAYLILYAFLYVKEDPKDPQSFINSDLNFTLYFVISLCYIVYIAGAIKSYTMGDKYKDTFKWFWILGVVLTLFFFLLIVMNYITTGAGQPAEFMPSE